MKRLDFDKTLIEAVDHALLALGESPRNALYRHLIKGFKLKRESILEDTEEFSNALNTLFGPGGQVIEKLIVKNLYNKLNLSYEEKTCFEFVDYISLARDVARREQQRLKVRGSRRRSPHEHK